MDTDTQSSSSSLCNVSTDKNVNACSMEPLDEKQMLRDIKRELAKDLNNDLIEGYRTCGISNDALKELKSNGPRALSEEVPLLEFFNIPLVPGIIRKVLQNIVKLSCLFPDVELMSYDTYGGDHKNVIFSMPQASSRESFMKKGSQDIICNIPKRLVNTSQFEEIENGVERNGAIKKAEFKRKRLRHDKRTSNVKSFDEKANMYARHDRMVKHDPSVLEEVKIYEAGRPKRSPGDARLVNSRLNKVAKKAECDDQRNDVKKEDKDYLS